jgi:hypothetical protein
MSVNQEFENWAGSRKDRNNLPHFLMKDSDGDYVDQGANIALEAWKASREHVSVPDVTVFGLGNLVVVKGRYGDKPAVFVVPAQNGPGVVGELSAAREPSQRYNLIPGEWVMTFPSDEQAKRVCKALWNIYEPAEPSL